MDDWRIVVASYLEGEITKEMMADAIILLDGREPFQTEQKAENHIRLNGLSQIQGQEPTAIQISIEEGGTLTSLEGKKLWAGFVSVESFEETASLYTAAKSLGRSTTMPPNKQPNMNINKSI